MSVKPVAWTPGPWETHYSHDVTGYPCFFIHGMAGLEKDDAATLDANARLIASAPELAEALQKLVASCPHATAPIPCPYCQPALELLARITPK